MINHIYGDTFEWTVSLMKTLTGGYRLFRCQEYYAQSLYFPWSVQIYSFFQLVIRVAQKQINGYDVEIFTSSWNWLVIHHYERLVNRPNESKFQCYIEYLGVVTFHTNWTSLFVQLIANISRNGLVIVSLVQLPISVI